MATVRFQYEDDGEDTDTIENEEDGNEGDGEQKLYRQFQSILNKLTLQKVHKLAEQALALAINTEERLIMVTDQVFERALSEPIFSAAYANLCKYMLNLKVPWESDPKYFVKFHHLLLNKCRCELDSDIERTLDLFSRKEAASDMPDDDEKIKLEAQIELDMHRAHRRLTGNICFAGELFKLKMVPENMMHDCIFKLLVARDPESLECLCHLLTTIGRELDTPKAKPRMDRYFIQLEKMVFGEKLFSEAIRSKIHDVIKLRDDDWESWE